MKLLFICSLIDGLSHVDGVVFLDEHDRKMILVRDRMRVWPLSQCEINKDRRFAFYDQVHTTGMDIQHALNAKAVLTIGKDMIFRDCVQGAFSYAWYWKKSNYSIIPYSRS